MTIDAVQPLDSRYGSLARAESPQRRAWRALRRKRIAMVALALIVVIYGAGAYTILDAFGVPIGLQDPEATNLTERRPVREVDGVVETLGVYMAHHQISLEELRRLNPETVALVEAEVGPLSSATVVPPRTTFVLKEDEVLESPSADHWFGTDRIGRDMFSRTLFAARTTLLISILAFLFGNVFLGLGLGLVAGYLGGKVDNVIMRVGDVVLAIPTLLVLILVSASLRDRWTEWFAAIDDFLGTTFFIDQGIDDFSLLFFSVSFFSWVGTARFVRAQVFALREQEYVLAAEALGARMPRILLRHLLPGVLPWIVVGISATLGAIATLEVALTFLGIGVQAPTASFGAMIDDAGGVRTFNLHPHLLLVPGVTVAVLIFAFNLLGDAVNDVVNPRGR
ncbi:MAG: ABC transporter permease [Chloroflexi bacterium]|nr:ABC transporter permease [Chloroflexota bacterium]